MCLTLLQFVLLCVWYLLFLPNCKNTCLGIFTVGTIDTNPMHEVRWILRPQEGNTQDQRSERFWDVSFVFVAWGLFSDNGPALLFFATLKCTLAYTCRCLVGRSCQECRHGRVNEMRPAPLVSLHSPATQYKFVLFGPVNRGWQVPIVPLVS